MLCFSLELLEHYHKFSCRNDGPNYFILTFVNKINLFTTTTKKPAAFSINIYNPPSSVLILTNPQSN